MSRVRAYVFTINNYVESDISDIKALKDKAQYMIVGDEKGEEGTPHLQGYVYFSHPKVFGSLKKKLPRAHLEVAKGTPQENKKYCSKQKVLFEFGDIPQQGKRNDIDEVRDILKDPSCNAPMRTVVNQATSYQSIRVAEVWLKYHERKRQWKPEVKWFWGPTGAGKTFSAHQWLGDEDTWVSGEDGKWFDGYDGHENVIFDEFRRDFCKFHVLLKLLDRYPYQLPVKGTFRQFLAKKIAITSCYHPEDVYSTREDVQQLLRRIDEIIPVGDAKRESEKRKEMLVKSVYDEEDI